MPMLQDIGANLADNKVYLIVGLIVIWVGASLLYNHFTHDDKHNEHNPLRWTAKKFLDIASTVFTTIASVGTLLVITDMMNLRKEGFGPNKTVAVMMAMMWLAVGSVQPLSADECDFTSCNLKFTSLMLSIVVSSIGVYLVYKAGSTKGLHNVVVNKYRQN